MQKKKNEIITFIVSDLKDQKLFTELVEQLEKDILFSGLDVGSLNSESVKDYINSLNEFIETTLRINPEKLRALFYRVDVKESEITGLFQDSISNDDLILNLSKSLLYRELQKVISRKKYR